MTVYVLFVDYQNGDPELVCGVFTSEEIALKHTWSGYSYRVQKFTLDDHY
jgi:hypothetical protein